MFQTVAFVFSVYSVTKQIKETNTEINEMAMCTFWRFKVNSKQKVTDFVNYTGNKAKGSTLYVNLLLLFIVVILLHK